MKANLENFKPRLRPGRVIPQGSRIIFETDNPYNQIVLPMILADLVLLCSGQFSVREIIEKIYKKQGSVPFKSMLQAIHLLHQGDFFDNGDELELSSHLSSWVSPSRSRFHLSWRFGQRIMSDSSSPMGFYLLTLILLLGCIGGFQYFPMHPMELMQSWLNQNSYIYSIAALFVVSSVIQTMRHAIKGLQLLLVTGKAYNVAFRLSPWGIHLHVGDEASDLFENRLYTSMFHLSQIFIGWAAVFVSDLLFSDMLVTTTIMAALMMTAWELNPFVNSEGRKLIRDLFLPSDREVVSWHFESNALLTSMSPETKRQEDDFTRICRIWGSIWLLMILTVLQETALVFGPGVSEGINGDLVTAITSSIFATAWLFSVCAVIYTFYNWILAPLMKPFARQAFASVRQIALKPAAREWPVDELVSKLDALPLFSHFPEQYLQKLLTQSQVLEAKTGGAIIQQGDSSRELYVLLEGKVEIIRSQGGSDAEWISELNAVSVFGEAALVDDSSRGAHVIAASRSYVLRVPVHVIRQIAQEAQSVRQLEDFRNAILVNQFFASSPVFRSLTAGSIDFLSSRGYLEYADKGQKIFAQGEAGDSLYLILRGTVDVEVHGTHVKRLSQGSFFGEIALIANIPRTASITATEPSVFFKISADSFWEVLVQHIDLGVFIETVSESRLREDLEVAALPLRPTGTGSF